MHQVGGGGQGNNGVSGDEVCAKDDAANGERESAIVPKSRPMGRLMTEGSDLKKTSNDHDAG